MVTRLNHYQAWALRLYGRLVNPLTRDYPALAEWARRLFVPDGLALYHQRRIYLLLIAAHAGYRKGWEKQEKRKPKGAKGKGADQNAAPRRRGRFRVPGRGRSGRRF